MREDFKKIIEESGNNLHIDTVKLLETMDWDVDLSSYYYDDTTNKPREIDIVAQKEISICDEFKEEIDNFKLFLFIECKYFKNELAFRVRENREKEAKAALIIEGMNKELLLEREHLFSHHHYLQTSFVGKLYDSLPEDQTKVFNAITQPIKSLIFFKQHSLKTEVEKGKKKGIYYPIVIYSGIDGIYSIKDVDIENLDDLQKEENIMFSLNYSYKSHYESIFAEKGRLTEALITQHFYIDFINQKRLKDYVSMILKEAEELKGYLFYNRKRGK